jgi:hypothetical protein
MRDLDDDLYALWDTLICLRDTGAIPRESVGASFERLGRIAYEIGAAKTSVMPGDEAEQIDRLHEKGGL